MVNYDQSKQNSLFAALGLGGFNWKTLLLVLPVGLLLALLPLLRWWAAGRRRDVLNEGFMLLKSALLGDDNEQLAAASAGEIKALLQQHGIDDAQLVRLLDEYEHWLYAAEPPAARVQRRWLRQARRTAARYRRSARQAV